MKHIPPRETEPEIFLFESLEDLREELGHSHTHGLYDSVKNRIYATWDSLPHEIAHFKDFRSGKLRTIRKITDPKEKVRTLLRNEMLAVLYAWQKLAKPSSFLSYEKEFLEAVYYFIENQSASNMKSLDHFSFSELQEFADKLASPEHPLFEKFKVLFSHYLDGTQESVVTITSLG